MNRQEKNHSKWKPLIHICWIYSKSHSTVIIDRVYQRLIMTDKAKGQLDTFNIRKYGITFSKYVCRTADLFQSCYR